MASKDPKDPKARPEGPKDPLDRLPPWLRSLIGGKSRTGREVQDIQGEVKGVEPAQWTEEFSVTNLISFEELEKIILPGGTVSDIFATHIRDSDMLPLGPREREEDKAPVAVGVDDFRNQLRMHVNETLVEEFVNKCPNLEPIRLLSSGKSRLAWLVRDKEDNTLWVAKFDRKKIDVGLGCKEERSNIFGFRNAFNYFYPDDDELPIPQIKEYSFGEGWLVQEYTPQINTRNPSTLSLSQAVECMRGLSKLVRVCVETNQLLVDLSINDYSIIRNVGSAHARLVVMDWDAVKYSTDLGMDKPYRAGNDVARQGAGSGNLFVSLLDQLIKKSGDTASHSLNLVRGIAVKREPLTPNQFKGLVDLVDSIMQQELSRVLLEVKILLDSPKPYDFDTHTKLIAFRSVLLDMPSDGKDNLETIKRELALHIDSNTFGGVSYELYCRYYDFINGTITSRAKVKELDVEGFQVALAENLLQMDNQLSVLQRTMIVEIINVFGINSGRAMWLLRKLKDEVGDRNTIVIYLEGKIGQVVAIEKKLKQPSSSVGDLPTFDKYADVADEVVQNKYIPEIDKRLGNITFESYIGDRTGLQPQGMLREIRTLLLAHMAVDLVSIDYLRGMISQFIKALKVEGNGVEYLEQDIMRGINLDSDRRKALEELFSNIRNELGYAGVILTTEIDAAMNLENIPERTLSRETTDLLPYLVNHSSSSTIWVVLSSGRGRELSEFKHIGSYVAWVESQINRPGITFDSPWYRGIIPPSMFDTLGQLCSASLRQNKYDLMYSLNRINIWNLDCVNDSAGKEAVRELIDYGRQLLPTLS